MAFCAYSCFSVIRPFVARLHVVPTNEMMPRRDRSIWICRARRRLFVVAKTPHLSTVPSPSKYAWRNAAISASGHLNSTSGTVFVAEFVGMVKPRVSQNGRSLRTSPYLSMLLSARHVLKTSLSHYRRPYILNPVL